MKKEIKFSILVFSFLILSLFLMGFLVFALPAPPASPTMGTNTLVNASVPQVISTVNNISNLEDSSSEPSKIGSILSSSITGLIIFIVIVILAYFFFLKLSKK
jgi:hypothetical protein